MTGKFHRITFEELERVIHEVREDMGDFCTSLTVWSDEFLRQELTELVRDSKMPEVVPDKTSESQLYYSGIPVFTNRYLPMGKVVATSAQGNVEVIDLDA